MRLVVSDDARTDLIETYQFGLEHWGRAASGAYVGVIRTQMKSLARGETSGVSADDADLGLRRLVVRSHVIWFRIVGTELRVVRVLHQSRDAGRWVE